MKLLSSDRLQRFVVLATIGIVFSCMQISAQPDASGGGNIPSGWNLGVTNLARPGAITINVNLVSAMLQSQQASGGQGAGRFEIPKGMRLDEFLYTVGVFGILGETDDRIFLTGSDQLITTMKVSRNTSQGRIIVYEENFEVLLSGMHVPPVLEDEDLIIVDREIIRGRDPVRTLNYFTGAVSVATLAVSIIALLR